MKIAVCFKALADFGRLPEKEWLWDQDLIVDTRFVRRLFNCFEESALEMALTLARPLEEGADPAELTALTVDDSQGDLFLRLLAAVGVDHGVRIQCDPRIDLRVNPLAVSLLISTYIKQEGHQLVILGMQGGEGDNQQTGFLVAERLGWPCMSPVTCVTRAGAADCLEVTSQIHGARLKQTVTLPLVLIVGHSPVSPCLRVPTLKQKLAARNRLPLLVTEGDLGLDFDTLTHNDKRLVALHRPQGSKPCLFLKGRTSKEQAQELYDLFLKERLT